MFDDAATEKFDSRRPSTSRSTSFESIDDARFVPGTILAERYRIVGLLGKGGMGEVYRADDLKLSQPVALKTVALFVIALAIEVSAFAASAPRLYWIASILIALTIVTVVARFGLLATMAAQLVFFLSLVYPMTTDFSVWYASSTIFALVIILGLAIYGFYISLGGQRVFAGRSFGLD